MSNVLSRLFHRHAAPAAAEGPYVRADAAVALGPETPRPANDVAPLNAVNEATPVVSASEPAPVKATSDEEIVEQQIAALVSAWDRASLRARRKFLTRIDQRIMTAHLARVGSSSPAGDAAAFNPDGAAVAVVAPWK
jgi:hypothetical protein